LPLRIVVLRDSDVFLFRIHFVYIIVKHNFVKSHGLPVFSLVFFFYVRIFIRVFNSWISSLFVGHSIMVNTSWSRFYEIRENRRIWSSEEGVASFLVNRGKSCRLAREDVVL
jgi:hypothetical protein